MKRSIFHSLIVSVALCLTLPAHAQTPGTPAGSGTGVSTPVFVEFDITNEGWQLNMSIIFDPGAPGILKQFQSPLGATGGPIQLDALQPFPQPVWENFQLVGGPPVADWHEEILTPGWEWIVPDPAGLITRNGVPWPSQIDPLSTPTMLWVDFDPIVPSPLGGVVLDIHKELVWVGTPGNRIWGDGALDDGTALGESIIEVFEYPTPEPTTLALLGIGTIVLLRRR